jgi:hypothetical protein
MKTPMMMIVTLFLAIGLFQGLAHGQQQAAPPIPAEEQPEVLTQGPLNEAFAQPVDMENQPGLVAPTEPPNDIEEIPPAERPAGDQFIWVSGYWAWDSDRNDYIWVSGCWREAPPGMSWIPGYWTEAQGGWRWVQGFWAPRAQKEVEYYSAPPELTNVEPPGPPPSPDQIWVPPCWYRHDGQFVLRPGYWINARPDWVWVPAHYVWTPRGYIFLSGHWDFPLNRRGVLFAPVYFPGRALEPVYSYSLSIAIDLDNLESALFVRPRYSHYYFGDYYDNVYIGMGIFPWFECVQRHTWYDPIYMHDRWRRHRDFPKWEEHERHEFDRRRADTSLRPPRTYRELEHRLGSMPGDQRRSFEMAAPMMEVFSHKNAFNFQKTAPKDMHHSIDFRNSNRERNKGGSQGSVHQGPGKDMQPFNPVKPVPSMKDDQHRMKPKGPALPVPESHVGRGQERYGSKPQAIPGGRHVQPYEPLKLAPGKKGDEIQGEPPMAPRDKENGVKRNVYNPQGVRVMPDQKDSNQNIVHHPEFHSSDSAGFGSPKQNGNPMGRKPPFWSEEESKGGGKKGNRGLRQTDR